MNDIDLASLMSRSSLFDADAVDWHAVARYPLPHEALRTLCYMQDIESHTIVYLRELMSTRVVDDPEIAGFFATWFYEETAHGRVLARFLDAAGQPVAPRPRRTRGLVARIEALGMTCIGAAWGEFPAVHMTWGAINELTTLTAYRRLAHLAGHPVLSELLAQIMRDESRHFHFYFDQAERRLAASATTRRVTRALVKCFWDPVGAGVQRDSETRFLASYLFSGPDGRAAAQTIDRTIRRLPGFADIPLAEAWMARNCVRRESTRQIATATA
jgi:Fatty acid desaturase